MSVDQLLGRRLRPWWGRSPYWLIPRGAVQGAIFALIAYGCMAVTAGRVDVAELGLEQKQAWAERAAGIVLILAIIGVAYGTLRVVVGVLDLFTRGTVSGTVVGIAERKYGDFLPPIAQRLIWSNRRDEHGDRKGDRRRTRLQLTLQTDDGVQSWTVGTKFAGRLAQGQKVQLRASTLLGHVSKVS